MIEAYFLKHLSYKYKTPFYRSLAKILKKLKILIQFKLILFFLNLINKYFFCSNLIQNKDLKNFIYKLLY